MLKQNRVRSISDSVLFEHIVHTNSKLLKARRDPPQINLTPRLKSKKSVSKRLKLDFNINTRWQI